MKWFDGEINSLKSSLIPYTMHGINERIYDEIVKKEDGFYYLIIRCGVMPYTNVHTFTEFKTDGINIVYPLPNSEIKEIKLDWIPPNVFGDNSTILVNSGAVIPEFTGSVEVDRRYKEYRKYVSGENIELSTSDIDSNRKIYIEEVIGTENGLGELLVNEQGVPILDEQFREQYKIEIKNTGKNLINPKDILKKKYETPTGTIVSPSLHTVVEVTDDVITVIPTNIGEVSASTEYIHIQPGKTYCTKIYTIEGPTMYIRGRTFYNLKKERIGGQWDGTHDTFEAPEDAHYVVFGFTTANPNTMTKFKMQLEEGKKSTDYELYKESVATIISPKRLFANEKLSWNSAREKYEVTPVFIESEPVKDGLVAWIDGRDGQHENYIWKDRSGNGNDIDMTPLKDYIEWDNASYIIKPGSQGLISSLIKTNCPDGYTVEVDFEADFWLGNMRMFGGSQYIETDFNKTDSNSVPKLFYINKDIKNQIDTKLFKQGMCVSYSISSDAVNIHVNGTSVVQEMSGNFTFEPEAVFFIGNEGENHEYIRINSIKIYKKQLSDEEVVKNYKYNKSINRDAEITLPNTEHDPVLEGMVAWLDARDNNDTTENVWIDRTENGYDFDILNLAHNSTNGWINNRLNLNESNKNIVRCKKPIKFHSMIVHMDNDLNVGSYLVDGRHNVTNSYAGFAGDVYLMNTYKKVVYEDGTYTEGGKNLHLKRNQSIYYLECAQLTTFNQLHLFGRYSADSGFLSCRVKSIIFYDRPLTDDEIDENRRHYDSVYVWENGSNNKNTSAARINSLTIQKKTELSLFEGENFISTTGGITIDVPYKEVRYLDYPRDVVATVPPDSDLVTLDWTSVTGAQQYKILLDGEYFDTVNTNHWEYREELKGFLSVIAVNDVTESKQSESVYVLSVPNETYVSYIKNEYDNGYKFEIHFPDMSDMETSYKVYYKVDDRQEQHDILSKSETIGTVIKHSISVPIILDRMQIRVVSVNETGENTVVPPTVLYITETPIWAYKKETESALISWTNRFENVTRYAAKIYVNGVFQGEENIDVNDAEVGSKVTYSYPLKENDMLKISIAAVMGDIYHIYSEEVSISKALDKTLAPPSDFRYRRLADNQIEFTWYDDYDCEDGFEITYSLSNGEPQTIFVPSTTVSATNRRYSYVYTFDEHGFITAKVRMKWELGVSDYSQEETIYYLPASGLPPAYIRREVVDGHIKVHWEGQQYVDKYELHKTVGPQTEIISISDNSYEFNLDYNYDKKEFNAFTPDNAWTIKRYSPERYTANNIGKHWIEGLNPLEIIKKPANASITPSWGTYFIAHGETYIYLRRDLSLELTVGIDDTGCVLINDEKVASGGGNITFKANFNKGWNRIEILVYQAAGGFNMSLSKALTSYLEIEKIASEFITEPLKVELSIVTKFLNETVSEPSTPMIFYPQYSGYDFDNTIITKSSVSKNIDTNIYTKTKDEFVLDVKSMSDTSIDYLLTEKSIGKFLTTEGPMEVSVTGKNLETAFSLDTILINANSRQSEYTVGTVSIKKALLDHLMYTTITTKTQSEYLIHTEVNRVRICTIGDSITAGHPNFWAETMTGNEQSQYQYWLNRRLKGQYEIINKGYGSDTTDRMLERFDKDVLEYNPTYCIIQGGTNDLYWAMAEADGDQAALDRKVQLMKENIMEMVKRCWNNGITPIVGTLIPRTGAVGIYKKALYDYNEWIIEYCSTNENINFVDFFNAGKDAFPPTPLEDPLNPGALNPIYDGDAIYDDYGNLIKQGRGIHPSVEGYKIMGEAIPLDLFRTEEEGLKLYLDEECTKEEVYNQEDKLNPFYMLTVDNITRGKTKQVVRYVKNIGSAQVLFAAFASSEHSVEINFLDENNNKKKYANALLHPSRVAEIRIEFNVLNDDVVSTARLHLASRKLTTN